MLGSGSDHTCSFLHGRHGHVSNRSRHDLRRLLLIVSNAFSRIMPSHRGIGGGAVSSSSRLAARIFSSVRTSLIVHLGLSAFVLVY